MLDGLWLRLLTRLIIRDSQSRADLHSSGIQQRRIMLEVIANMVKWHGRIGKIKPKKKVGYQQRRQSDLLRDPIDGVGTRDHDAVPYDFDDSSSSLSDEERVMFWISNGRHGLWYVVCLRETMKTSLTTLYWKSAANAILEGIKTSKPSLKTTW